MLFGVCGGRTQYTAIAWINEFVILSGAALLPFTSGILTAILPCMAHDDVDVTSGGSSSSSSKELRETTRQVNANLMRLVDADASSSMELASVVSVLDLHLGHSSVHTKVAVLHWIEHLLSQLPGSVCLRFPSSPNSSVRV